MKDLNKKHPIDAEYDKMLNGYINELDNWRKKVHSTFFGTISPDEHKGIDKHIDPIITLLKQKQMQKILDKKRHLITKRNVKKQEELVSALYRFSEGIQENPHDCKYGENASKSIHLESVGNALKDIMRIFGYDVTPIQ